MKAWRCRALLVLLVVLLGAWVSGASAKTGGVGGAAVAVAASGQSPLGVSERPASVPADAQEIPSLRSRVSDTFMVPGARQYLSTVYPYSVNYRDASGLWQPIDDTLVSSSDSGYALQNTANRYKLELPSDLGTMPVRVALGDQWLSFGLVGAHGAPSASGSSATYADALPGVSVSYRAENDLVKESVSLASAAAAGALSYTLQVSSGLSPQLEKDGSVQFSDASGKIVAAFAAPSMRDASGASSSAVAVSLSPTSSGSAWTLTETPSATWLAAPGRAFPVVVDPSVVFYSNNLPTDVDCTISTSSPGTPLCGGQTLDVGYDGTNTSRSLLQFHVEDALPNNSQVLNAQLHLYLESVSGSGSATLAAHQLNEAWSSYATWNNRDFYNAWTNPGGTFDPNAAATTSVGTTPGWYTLYPTTLTSGWLHTTTTDDGLLLKASDESTNDVMHFASAENSDPSVAPYLTVYWQAWLGNQHWYTLDTQQITDRLALHVNLATGNLMAEANDLNLSGVAGDDLSVSRWLNNLSGITGDLGNNWLMTVGRDVGLSTFPDGSVVVYMPSGAQFLFLKNGSSFTSPAGADADLTKNDSTGEYTLSFHGNGDVWTFDSSGRLATQKDKNGNTITYNYDPANGSLSSITDSRGQTTSFSYGSDGYISEITDPSGRTFQYDRSGDPGIPNLTSYTDPNAGTTQFTYAHPHGQWDLTGIITPDGHQVFLSYDSESRVVSIARPDGNGNEPTWTFSYATSDSRCPSGTVSVVSETDPNQHTTVYCSDALARVTKTIDPLGRTSSTSWNSNNNVKSTTNTAGGTSDYTYDSNNPENLTKVEGPANPQGLRQTDTYGYTDSSHPFYPTAYTDAQNHSWALKYDNAGNQIQQSEGNAPGQNPVSTDYNSNGTVAGVLDAKQTDACTDSKNNSETVCYSYDSSHNPSEIDYPSPLGSFHFTWDTVNRLASITDGKNQTTSYSYDALDRLTKITYQDGSTISYAYDGDGNLTSETDGSAVTTYSYDDLNRLVSETKPDNTTIEYGYDAAGQLTSVTENNQTTSYSYDAAGRLTSIQESTSPSAISISYPDETHTTITYPGGATVNSSYDNAFRLTSITDKNGTGNTVASYSYGYTWTDPNNVQHDGSQRSSVTTLDGTTNYTYDTVGRLVDANGPDGEFSYSYDPNGNMTSKTTPSGTTNYTVNNANELTSPWSYDANGNQTAGPDQTLTYNDREQTSSITPTGGSALAASYFGAGQTQRTGFAGDNFLHDSLGIGRWTSGSTTTDFTRDPTSQTQLAENVNGSHYYYAFDGLGSVVGLFDSSGNLVSNYVQHYQPYGKPINTPPTGYPPMPVKFAGYWYDSQTGLYQVGARYYDPTTGRWTQRDPVDNPYDLHGWNRYIYAGDDPINSTDPSGMCWTGFCWAAHAADWAWHNSYVRTCFTGAAFGAVEDGPAGALIGCATNVGIEALSHSGNPWVRRGANIAAVALAMRDVADIGSKDLALLSRLRRLRYG